jgi:hypothetical protein
MIVDQGGCPYNFPGVGDISYVKDLMTEEIVSRDFSCSIFGAYSHPIAKIGWVRYFNPVSANDNNALTKIIGFKINITERKLA